MIPKMAERMCDVIPEGKQGLAEIAHYDISEAAARAAMISALANSHRQRAPSAGRYCMLTVNKHLVMSDTFEERYTNYDLLRAARGDVLIAGLGIGMVLTSILKKPEVDSVLVIEKHQDVIDLVEPHIKKVCRKGMLFEVTCADIFDWKPPKGQKWDAIYFDIWPDARINLEQSTRLKRKFARRKQGIEWMQSWNEKTTRMWNRQGVR